MWLKNKMFLYCFVLFYKNLKSSFLHDSHIWLWGFFTLLVALAHGAPCTWNAVHLGRGCRVATIDGNWTGVDDNYPPNNCFPLKQDWKLPTKCVRLETCVYVTVGFAIAFGNIHKLRPILGQLRISIKKMPLQKNAHEAACLSWAWKWCKCTTE